MDEDEERACPAGRGGGGALNGLGVTVADPAGGGDDSISSSHDNAETAGASALPGEEA